MPDPHHAPSAPHLPPVPPTQMMTSAIYGMPVLPAAIADERGNAVVVQRAASAAWLERLLRPVCTEMGCSAGFSSCPLIGKPPPTLLHCGCILL